MAYRTQAPRSHSTGKAIAATTAGVAALLLAAGIAAVGCAKEQAAATKPAAADSVQAKGDGSGGRLVVGGGTIDYQIVGANPQLPPAAITEWIRTAAEGAVSVCGRYPVDRVDITVRVGGRGKVEDGVTRDGRSIMVRLGRRARPDDLHDDWVMTHEMFHLAFPTTDDDFNWIGEGLSTYLEPLARGRVGMLNEAEVWGGYVLGMPQGQPEPGDKGLNRTHTWGRTYWGGALFWLSADVEIRRQTNNRKSLDDVVKTVLAAGGSGHQLWSPDRIVDVGDRGTGTRVLQTLYDRYAVQAEQIDLTALWASLGVKPVGDGTIEFDDRAPLAAIRKSMTAKPG